MGFFSWLTSDTGVSIPNVHSSQPTRTVYMHDDKGNVWEEGSYGGYGKFGGKDYYELCAEMNGLEDRDEAIISRDDASMIHPQLTHLPELPPDTDFFKAPRSCPYQGFFY